MKKQWLAVLVAMVGCGGDDSSEKTPDAAKSVDAAKTADAAVDAAPTSGSAKSHTLFLNTEGVTVKPGSEDATKDQSGLASHSATLAPYLVGGADRATEIASLVTDIEGILAPYAVTVTNARPAAGPYDEIVLTDSDPSASGFPPSAALLATTCNMEASVMGFAFPARLDASYRHATVVQFAVSMFATFGGVPESAKAGDCMCYQNDVCAPSATLCTIGGAGTPVDQSPAACGETATTMDEHAKFLAAFGPHQ